MVRLPADVCHSHKDSENVTKKKKQGARHESDGSRGSKGPFGVTVAVVSVGAMVVAVAMVVFVTVFVPFRVAAAAAAAAAAAVTVTVTVAAVYFSRH